MHLHLSVESRLPGGRLRIDGLRVAGLTALVGPSGVGKSTVLEYIAGLRHPERGLIRCGGRIWLDTENGVRESAGARSVGYVPQDLALFPHMSARDNVAWGIRGRRDRRRTRAEELLERFRLGESGGRRAAELSGGERRRVALARALATEPMALLLDEPFTGLDAAARADATDLVRDTCARAGVPALLVSHDFDDVARVASQVAVIEEGTVSQIGSPHALSATPRTAYVAALAGVNAFTGTATRSGRLTRVDRPSGPPIWSPDAVVGRVLASVHPADVRLSTSQPADAENALPARVVGRIPRGARHRVDLALPESMVAEVGPADPGRPGEDIWAAWTAGATRLAG